MSISLIKTVIEESKKIRESRGDTFDSIFDNNQPKAIIKKEKSRPDFKSTRDSHVRLNNLIVDFDKKIVDKFEPYKTPNKKSKYVQVYINDEIENFLKNGVRPYISKWNLRKNSGVGSIIKRVLLDFIKLKRREAKQLGRISLCINNFKSNLVTFKNLSKDPLNYLEAERVKLTLSELSQELKTLIIILEIPDEDLKDQLSLDQYKWVEFTIKWGSYS